MDRNIPNLSCASFRRVLPAITACMTAIPACVGLSQQCPAVQVDIYQLDDPPFSTAFGDAFDLEGDLMLIGSPEVDVLPDSNGEVWPYRFENGEWVPQQPFISSDGSFSARFGTDIEIEGTTAVIGSVCQFGIGTSKTGAAYIFDYDGTQWTETAKLAPPADSSSCDYGQKVAFSDGLVCVSAYDNSAGPGSGAVFVYEKVGGSWAETQVVTSSVLGSGLGIWFGRGMRMEDGVLAVGGVNRYDWGDGIGYAEIFRNVNGQFVFEQLITDPEDQVFSHFGESFDIDGDRMVIGAKFFQLPGQGYVGAAFIYEFDGNNWNLVQQFNEPTPNDMNCYGYDVALDGDTLLVSATFASENGIRSGKTYAYRNTQSGWVLVDEILPETQVEVGQFGWYLWLEDEKAMISSESSRNPPSNGDGTGLVYVYDIQCDTGCQNPADVNGDGMISPTDFTAWINAYNNSLPTCDQNDDSTCTPTDFTAWIDNYNLGC